MSVFFLDRITKYNACQKFLSESSLPYITYTVTMNRGISWGWLHTEDPTLQSHVVSWLIGLIILLLGYYAYVRWQKNEIIWPYILVLSGAVSNMIDRIFYGGVIDFIEISWNNLSWPVFNVADMCIVLGISCIVVWELRQ